MCDAHTQSERESNDEMRILTFMHAKLDVANLEASETFYRDLLGLSELCRYQIPKGEIVQYVPIGGIAGVELWFEGNRAIAEPTECHIAFQVDDARAWCEQLALKGVVVDQLPFDIGHETICFVRDPDGYLVELNQNHELDQ